VNAGGSCRARSETAEGRGLRQPAIRRGLVRRVLAGLCRLGIVPGLALLVSCSPATVWRAEARSPGGDYIATVRTVQQAGPGDNWIVTSVSLEQAGIPQTRMVVLSFFCEGPVPRPFTLDNKANVGGTIDLRMRWLTPTHLGVTYNGDGATLNFQAVRYQVVTISLTDLSKKVGRE
jgi:hypothetical protein